MIHASGPFLYPWDFTQNIMGTKALPYCWIISARKETRCPLVCSPQKQKLVRHLPLANLLVETDSPALAALVGERNEPAQIPPLLLAIAQLKKIPVSRITETVYRNAKGFYRI